MSTTAQGADAPAPASVLLVDDEPDVLAVLERVLSRHGWRCTTATGAREALSAVARGVPALVLADIRMPGEDGLWLLDELKSRFPRLPVIMMTAAADAKGAVRCLKKGAFDYLTKPLDIDEVVLTVRQVLEGGGLVGGVAGDDPSRGGTTTPLSPAAPAAAVPSESLLATALDLVRAGASVADLGTAIVRGLVATGAVKGARLRLTDPHSDAPRTVAQAGAGVDDAAAARAGGADPRAGSVRGVAIEAGRDLRGVLEIAADEPIPESVLALSRRLAFLVETTLARARRPDETRDTAPAQDRGELAKSARQLDFLYQMAGATRYSLDLRHVARFLLSSLESMVDYEAAGLLLLDEPSLDLHLRVPASPALLDRVRAHIVNTLRLTCGIELEETLVERVSAPAAGPSEELDAEDKLRSFVNVPLTVDGAVVGIVHVSSRRAEAFTDADVRFLNRTAGFLAGSVQGVRQLLATVKGRIEKMTEHMTDGVLMLDRRGEIVAANRAARSALGLGEDWAGPRGRARLTAVLEFDPLRAIESERRTLKRLVLVDEVPYQVLLSPVEDADGELSGAVLALRDFSEEARLDRRKTEFVNLVAHEIRTPLTAVRNALFLVGGDRVGGLGERQRHFVEMAQRNVEHLVALLNDLLDLSKLEAGKMSIDPGPIDVAGLVEDVVSSLEPQARAAGVDLETDLGEDLPELRGDRMALQRVLLNLVGNAIKFTGEGGRVRVEAESSAKGGVPSVRLVVADTGVGIPEGQLEAIFDKFHQVDATRGSRTGTGLGLPIARELVRAHHGELWAESEPGEGSRFIVEIPVLDEEQLFVRRLDEAITRARAQRLPLSVCVVRPASPGPSGPADVDAMAAAAEEVIRRSSDRVLRRRERGELVVVLPDTPLAGGRALERRLAERLGDGVRIASAAFPDDAGDAENLYAIAATRLEAAAQAVEP